MAAEEKVEGEKSLLSIAGILSEEEAEDMRGRIEKIRKRTRFGSIEEILELDMEHLETLK